MGEVTDQVTTAIILATPKNATPTTFQSICHPWFTTTNLSYRFPILKLPPQTCAVLLEYEVQCLVYVTYSKVGEGHVTFCPCVLCCVLVHWKQTNIIKTYMYCRWYPYIYYIYMYILSFEPVVFPDCNIDDSLSSKRNCRKYCVYAVFSAFGCRVFRVLGFRALGFRGLGF